MNENERKIRKRGFVVELRIFDRKLQQEIIAIDKACIDDLKKVKQELEEILGKFE